MSSELNPEGGSVKRGSFEITITTVDGENKTVWSGLELGLSFWLNLKCTISKSSLYFPGPPRRLKFPDPKVLLDNVKKSLQ